MNENPFTSIFLRVRDQYSAAVRWSYIAIILLLFFHLISIGPFVELNRQKTQTELDKKWLSSVESQIEILVSGFEHKILELDNRLGGFVQNLRDGFTRIDPTVQNLLKKAKTESELLPERIKLLIPDDLREIHKSILSASILFKFIKELHGIPEEESELPKEVEDQLREQLESPEFRKNALLKALKPFVEKSIIEPEYLKLNEDWKAEILPAIQTQFENLTKEMESVRSKFPEEPNMWKGLAASLKTTKLTVSNLKFKPPTEPPFWWSTVAEKELVRIELKDEVASWLQGPSVLISLREHVSTLLDDKEELGKKIQIKISKLEQQFKGQQDKLASLAKPLKFIALELNSILVLFPLLLGLIFAALTVWTTLCLHELGRITHLMVKQGADPLLWDWYCVQIFLLLPKPSADITEQSKSSLIRKSIGLCAMFWMWIGIAAWRLHGISEIEPGRLVVVTCIGATVVALAQVHRYVLLNSTLSLKATQEASVAPSSQE